MRIPGIDAGRSGVCGRLAREITGLLFYGDRTPTRAPSGVRRRDPHQRRLWIEPLESRNLMSATVSAVWFATVSATDVEHAGTASWTAENTIVSTDASTSAASTSTEYDWIIQFSTASLVGIDSAAETASLLVGGGIEFDVLRGLGLTGMVLVRSSGASLSAVESYLSANVSVAAFEQDALREADATTSSSSNSSALDAIDATEAWTITAGSTSVIVAVIDTGVDYTHTALAAYIWTNPGEIAGNGIDDDGNGFVDDVYGYDFANDDSDPMDDNSHGTHVSGIITSVASCSIMCLKFLDSDGSGYLSDAIEAINYATMMRSLYGVNVCVDNASWGGGSFSSALQSAIQAAGSAGILFVAAAGNEGTDNDTSAEYPANYNSANVISVAAVTSSNQLASFSNYGKTTVDIAAPGVSITSTTPGNSYTTYSGTSMATPYVSAVAALAYALAPDATVSEIREAILEGVTVVSSLSGKTVSGGVVNAYNTLKLLSDDLAVPVVSSLSVSSSTVMSGTSVTLTAKGITDAAGTVTKVLFYRDVNNNGTYDASDALVGSTTSVSGGSASVTVSTSGLASGSYRYLAVAVDDRAKTSVAVAAMLVVTAADDYGNSASTASAVSVPGKLSGTIGAAKDVDWFLFEAVAGKTYTISTTLGTLKDTVLYLYGSNGKTKLVYNDDYGSSAASRIVWTASASGTYYIVVAGYGSGSGTYALTVNRSNTAPTLASLVAQTRTSTQTVLTVALSASDADGDAFAVSAKAMIYDTLSQKAYSLDQQLNLKSYATKNFHLNSRGLHEKYLVGNGGKIYYILPNGTLYRWGGSIAKSTRVATLGAAYYKNPSLLYNAKSPTLKTIADGSVSATVVDGVLTVRCATGCPSTFYIQVTATDGMNSTVRTFQVSTVASSKSQMSASVAELAASCDAFAAVVDGDVSRQLGLATAWFMLAEDDKSGDFGTDVLERPTTSASVCDEVFSRLAQLDDLFAAIEETPAENVGTTLRDAISHDSLAGAASVNRTGVSSSPNNDFKLLELELLATDRGAIDAFFGAMAKSSLSGAG